VVQEIAYWGNQVLAETYNIVGPDYSYIFLKFNQSVPFLAWSIYPYVIAYPFWILSFFYFGWFSKKNLYETLMLSIITFAICGIWYLISQSDVTAWRESSGLFGQTDLNFTESLVMFIYNAAGPRNALPSMHCVMCWCAVCGVRNDKSLPVVGKIVLWVLSIAIIISTQTTKQHYIIDTIAAIAICESVYWLLKKTKISLWFQQVMTRLNQKLRIDWDEPARI